MNLQSAIFLLSLSIYFGLVVTSCASGGTPPFSVLAVASDRQLLYSSSISELSCQSNEIIILLSWRGGFNEHENSNGDTEDESEGSEYTDDREEGEDFDDARPRVGGGRYDHSLINPPTMDEEEKRRAMPINKHRRNRSTAHWSQRLASQSLKMGSQLAWGAVQQTGKVAYQLVKPRHVEARELIGLWRMDQQIVHNGRDLASVATIELDPRQRVVTLKLPNGKTVVEPFSFRKTRFGSYQTEFVAPAFLVGNTPRLYGYRGTWQRKLADKRVIKLVGKIYQVRKQRFGKTQGEYQFTQSIGTFVARRRMKLSEDNDKGDEEDGDETVGSDSEDEYEGQGEDDMDSDFSEGNEESPSLKRNKD